MAQSDDDLKSHINSLKMQGRMNLDNIEKESRFPTLLEIQDSIKNTDLEILSESISLDEIELKKGKEETIHSFSIKDSEIGYGADFTLKYPQSFKVDEEIKILLAIKSDLRILVKLLSSLSKKCGSFIVLTPYEAGFIDKSRSFNENWDQIRKDSLKGR
ncbi:hypothetical protein ACFSKU_13980 [Pontibacter silvestris]|uniref:Uncharacterized protein n=1 Tax=Pontibacter silvestris TaxID=2305183 RepID=A0ABW4X157_9BACT|nr:hypothetical protein [Pontibacter silvestris]MCC9135442.1 hypothetical protein [Pontibacter silvestris]